MEIKFIVLCWANLLGLCDANSSDRIGNPNMQTLQRYAQSKVYSIHCLFQLWVLGMTSIGQTDWFLLIWSHIARSTIPRQNSHTCSQGINCLSDFPAYEEMMLDVMCEIRDPDDKLRLIVRSSRQKGMTAAVSATNSLPIPPLHSLYGLFRGLFRGVYSGSVWEWINLRDVSKQKY